MFLRGGASKDSTLPPPGSRSHKALRSCQTIQLTIPRHTSGSWAYHRGFLGKEAYVGAGLGWG